jgi:hypothetical protein
MSFSSLPVKPLAGKQFRAAKWHLVRSNVPCAIVGGTYISFLFVVLCLLQVYPAIALTLNYAQIMIGGVTVLMDSSIWPFWKILVSRPSRAISEQGISKVRVVGLDPALHRLLTAISWMRYNNLQMMYCHLYPTSGKSVDNMIPVQSNGVVLWISPMIYVLYIYTFIHSRSRVSCRTSHSSFFMIIGCSE